jgi:hypothetical protein
VTKKFYNIDARSAITNGREPKSCLGRVFNSKLGCIATPGSKYMVCMQPLLKLKTRPKARPVSKSLSMIDAMVEFSFMHVIYSCCKEVFRGHCKHTFMQWPAYVATAVNYGRKSFKTLTLFIEKYL